MKKSLLIFAIALAGVSCNSATQGKKASQGLKTMTVELGSSTIETKYSTAIRGSEFVDLYPQVSGTITKILFEEGSAVKQGQALFIIDQVPYQSALAVAQAGVKSAQASVKTAQLNAKNARELYREGIISQNEMDITLNTLTESEAALALAKANEVSAQNNLSYTTITSPVDGVAGMIPYRVGALVSSSISSPLVSVAKNEKMYCYFSISESGFVTYAQQSASGDVASGMGDVYLELINGTRYPLKGAVDAVSGVVDRTTGSVAMRASFDNPNGVLLDGGSGSVIVLTQLDNVIVVPKIATFEIQNRTFAYTVVDGKAVGAQLTVYPYNNGNEYVVVKGLEVGDEIVAEGAGLVREGQQVTADKPKNE